MNTVQEKIAYLRGLITGADFFSKDQTAQSVWTQLLEILDHLASDVDDLREFQEEMEDYIDAIDDDLAELQEDVYGEDLDIDEDDDGWVDVVCPNCGDSVTFEEDALYDDDTEITCPHCGEVVYTGDNTVDDGDESSDTDRD